MTPPLPPVDNNMAATTTMPPATDPAMTADPYAAPAAERDEDRGFPWGLLGLLGLAGLLGRRRADRDTVDTRDRVDSRDRADR